MCQIIKEILFATKLRKLPGNFFDTTYRSLAQLRTSFRLHKIFLTTWVTPQSEIGTLFLSTPYIQQNILARLSHRVKYFFPIENTYFSSGLLLVQFPDYKRSVVRQIVAQKEVGVSTALLKLTLAQIVKRYKQSALVMTQYRTQPQSPGNHNYVLSVAVPTSEL